MLQTRLLASRAARSLRRPPQCRFDSSHSATPDAGHGASTPAHASHPPTESFSWKFYAAFLSIPIIYFISQDVANATPDNPPYLTGLITEWTAPNNKQWEERNQRFMDLVEQAAFDRALFQHSDKAQNIESRMPELITSSSPFAVHAGHSADLTEVIEFYKKKNQEMDERIRKKTPEQIYASGGDRPRPVREEKKG